MTTTRWLRPWPRLPSTNRRTLGNASRMSVTATVIIPSGYRSVAKRQSGLWRSGPVEGELRPRLRAASTSRPSEGCALPRCGQLEHANLALNNRRQGSAANPIGCGADHFRPIPSAVHSPATGQARDLISIEQAIAAVVGDLSDVDVTSSPATVRISGTIVSPAGKPTRRQPHPKTAKSTRTVSVPSFTAEVLRPAGQHRR